MPGKRCAAAWRHGRAFVVLPSTQGRGGRYEIVVSDPEFLPPETSGEARDAALALGLFGPFVVQVSASAGYSIC